MFEIVECWNDICEMVFPTKPKWTELTFTRPTWLKLQCYINLIGDYEITGFGRIVDNQIVDVKILKQKVKSATVDCDTEAMGEFLLSIPKDQRGQWTLDWHSHVKMGVFASGTDTDNYKEQYEARLRQQFPYIIVNQQGECYSKVYISPYKTTDLVIKVGNEPITRDELLAIYEGCKSDIQQLCSKRSYKTASSYSTGNLYTAWDNDDAWGKYYGYNATHLPTNHAGKSCCKQKKSPKDIINSPDIPTHDDTIDKSSSEDFCISCNTYLADANEFDRGICNDCWDLMSENDRYMYMKNAGLVK